MLTWMAKQMTLECLYLVLQDPVEVVAADEHNWQTCIEQSSHWLGRGRHLTDAEVAAGNLAATYVSCQGILLSTVSCLPWTARGQT